MRILALLEVLVVNLVLIALLLWISGDYGYRAAYWGPEGFTSTMVRYPLFYITSAVKGSTRIPGLLSVDWQQVVLLLLVVTDAVYAFSLAKSLRTSSQQENVPPNP